MVTVRLAIAERPEDGEAEKGRRDNDMTNSSVMATDNKWHDDQMNNVA